MMNGKDRRGQESDRRSGGRSRARDRRPGFTLEDLEARVLLSTTTSYIQYYLTWYQNQIKGTTTVTGPTNMVATAVGLQVNLTWTAATGTTTGTLTLERSTDNANFATIATPAVTATSYIDTNVVEATTYYYRLRVTGSAVSTQSFATTPVLNATGLNAVANSDGSVQLGWNDNSSVNTGYRVERSTDGVNFSQLTQVAGNVNSYKDAATSPSTTYYYRLVVLTSSGSLSPTSAVQATTVGPAVVGPSNMSASVAGLQINLTWAASTATTGSLTLERSTDNISFSTIATLAVNATSYSNTNLAEATTYYYRLRLTGAASASAQASATTGVLDATGLNATANSDGSVQLGWNDNSSVNTGYRVERSTDGVNFSQLTQVAGNVNSYKDTATSPSTTYFYHLVVLTSGGSLAPTSAVQVTTAAPAVVGPLNMSASAVGLQINLTWTASTATTGSLTLERSTDNVTFATIATLAVDATSYSNTNLAEATTYYYRLRLTGAASASAQASATTGVLNATGLNATANSDGSVQLGWNDNSAVNTGYRIERSTDGVNFSQLTQVAGNVNSYKDAATSPSTTYFYRLVVLTSGGSLTPTSAVQATTVGPAVAGPLNMSASAVGLQINLTWTASTATTGSLTLERSTDNVSFSTIATLAVNATSYSNTNLSEGTTYYYRLRLTGAASASTQASATTGVLNATGLNATANPDGSVQLGWTDNSSVNTGYRVERSTDGTNFSQIVQLAGNANSYKDTATSPSTTYFYRLVVLTSGGSLSPTPAVQVSTGSPVIVGPLNLSATVVGVRVDLSWTASNAATGSLTLERSTDNISFSTIGTLAVNATSYSNTNVAESTTYYYRLRLTGAPTATAQASVTTPIFNATGFNALGNSDGTVHTWWTDNSAVNTGYRVERSTNGVNFTPIATLGGSANSYTDTSAAWSTTYFYRLVELTSGGSLTPSSSVQVTTLAEPPAGVPADPNLVVNFGSTGVSSITYAGVKLYDPASQIGSPGGLVTYGTYSQTGEPQQTNGGPILNSSWDSATRTLTQVYAQFVLKTQYIITGANLDIIASATNTGSTDVAGFVVMPLFLTMPNAPVGFTGNPLVGFTSKGVVSLTADYLSGKVTLVGLDIVQNEIVGWQGPGGQFPNATFYGVRMGNVGYVGDSNWQVFDNRITPGATGVVRASLRFAPAGADVSKVANDVRAAYASTYPFNMQWNDRRTIGTVFLAAPQPGNRTATNPNGWLNDPTIDTTTTAGLEIFRTKMLAFADMVVANLVANNAQGVMFWDLEGSQYTNINYIGDPRLIGTFAPEMEYKGLVDEFLKKFTDAGLKLGMMLRASQLTLVNGTWEHRGSADMGQVLIDKMTYARQRWGATLFYIDSNEGTDVTPLKEAHLAMPDVLIIPENVSLELYAYGAPYRELRQGFPATSSDVINTYPLAFSAVALNDTNDATRATYRAALVAGIKRGDTIMIPWYDSAFARGLYQEAGF